MLSALNEAGAEFLIVGAYALAAHGLPRATGDIDIWVRSSEENARHVWNALRAFRAPTSRVVCSDFTRPDIVFQVGVAPRRIDILTSISGVDFEDAWSERHTTIIDGLQLHFLSRQHLIVNKRAAGRPKDLADLAWLESGNP
ncbi:MAG: hypothetical protein GXY83_35230 [Rhodopirellula sp.]|nr:hypothetical protein [Rhodopirellula sp.]